MTVAGHTHRLCGLRVHNAPYKAMLSTVHTAAVDDGAALDAKWTKVSDRPPLFTTYTHFQILLDSRRRPWLHTLLDSATLNVADGIAMRSALRLLDDAHVAAVNATDFHHHLLDDCLRNGKRIYLLGGSRNAAAVLPQQLAASVPGCHVRVHHGKIRTDDAALLGDISTFAPDVLFLGLGHPLQFEWIRDNLIVPDGPRLQIPLTVATGNFLEFLAGTQKRAPRWMRRAGLEWLHRLLREPARLWRRYLLGFPVFLLLVLREKMRKTFNPPPQSSRN